MKHSSATSRKAHPDLPDSSASQSVPGVYRNSEIRKIKGDPKVTNAQKNYERSKENDRTVLTKSYITKDNA